MPEFDKNKVLEQILKDVPVKLNLRGEVVIKGKKRVIYAFYQNSGIPDPDLKYDRQNEPIPTTIDSTMCEVYSGGGPRNKEFALEHQEKMKTDQLYARHKREYAKIFGTSVDSFDQGPNIEVSGMNPAAEARKGYSFDFYSSAFHFIQHFHQICERLGYNISLFNNSVQFTREVEVVERGNKLSVPLNVRADIGINLRHNDSTLKQVMGAIEKAYKKAEKADISSKKVQVVQYV